MISELAVLAQAAAPVFNAKFAVAIAGFGAAIGVGLVGWGATNAIGRNPGAFGKVFTTMLIGMALAEGLAVV